MNELLNFFEFLMLVIHPSCKVHLTTAKKSMAPKLRRPGTTNRSFTQSIRAITPFPAEYTHASTLALQFPSRWNPTAAAAWTAVSQPKRQHMIPGTARGRPINPDQTDKLHPTPEHTYGPMSFSIQGQNGLPSITTCTSSSACVGIG